MKKYCENCGEKVFSRGCTNCDEILYIEEQYEELEMQQSKEFQDEVADHRKKNETRLQSL